jgi:5-methyltetrahydrofolate--homocysteine methyltransferase
MEGSLESLYQSVMNGEQPVIKEKVLAALQSGNSPQIVLDTMINAMGEVGRLFEEGEYFVPEMLISARSMQTGLELLKPYLIKADIKPSGVVVIGTVKGDMHDIGKNLVCMMLEGAGFQVFDLGVDVPPEKFVSAVREHNPQLLALSALLTTTMESMKATIGALTEAGLRSQVKVIIGGAPVTSTFADQIGADGYAPDASQAVSLAKSLA